MRFHEPNGDEQKWNEAKNRKQIERKEKKKKTMNGRKLWNAKQFQSNLLYENEIGMNMMKDGEPI